MKSNKITKLCLASTHFLPARGGATLRFLGYCPGFIERGINIRILSGTPKAKNVMASDIKADGNTLSDGEILLPEAMEAIQTQRVRLPGKAGWPRSIRFSQAMLNFCRQPGYHPQVLQVVSSFQPRSIPWILRLRKLGIKVVYAYTIATKIPSNPAKRILRKWSLRALYNRVDCLLVSSHVTKKLALSMGADESRIVMIPNGVDLKRYHPAVDLYRRKELRSAFGLSDHHRMITMIGAVHPRKGSDLLLEAWVHLAKRFPEAHLFIVGVRKDLINPDLADFRKKINDLLAASGAADRVHFTGFIENAEDYLQASDVFVFPSLREGMPNAVIEAMASGLPVILTPFEGLSDDFGTPGKEYILAQHKSRSLNEAITEVLQRSEMRTNLGTCARKWIESKMDLERVLDRYADLYHGLADQSR